MVGTYSLPLFNNAAKLAMYGVSSSSNAVVPGAGSTTSVLGVGEIYGARLIKPFPSIKNYSHSLVAGVDYKNFKEDVGVISSSSTSAIKTPISYLPFTLQYNSSIRGEKSFISLN